MLPQRPKPHNGLWWIMAIVIITALLSSCYTQKKATDQVNKANDNFPEIVAKLARDKYPCTDLLKPDTAVIFKDTVIYVDCPDTATIANSPFEVIRTDTVNKVITKTIRVPVHLPIQVQTITKWYEDSAKLKLAGIQINTLQKDNDRLAAKLKARTKWMWIFLVIAICLTAWSLRKLFI